MAKITCSFSPSANRAFSRKLLTAAIPAEDERGLKAQRTTSTEVFLFGVGERLNCIGKTEYVPNTTQGFKIKLPAEPGKLTGSDVPLELSVAVLC